MLALSSSTITLDDLAEDGRSNHGGGYTYHSSTPSNDIESLRAEVRQPHDMVKALSPAAFPAIALPLQPAVALLPQPLLADTPPAQLAHVILMTHPSPAFRERCNKVPPTLSFNVK